MGSLVSRPMSMLKRMSRRLLRDAGVRQLPRPFAPDGSGYCWKADLPELAEQADCAAAPSRSTLVVYEDGVPQLSAHAEHEDIRRSGGGLFSHWHDTLYFSTSDNSDPNTNGRTYTYATSPRPSKRRAAKTPRAAHAVNRSHVLDTSANLSRQGHAWCAKVSAEFAPGDSPDHTAASPLILFENDRELGPRHSPHDTIRQVGGGAYSHWHDKLYFSTSDNSDPQTNGRTYRIAVRSVRVAVIALDGLTPQTLREYVAEGRLPTIAKIMARSREVEIDTECERFSVSAWPCFASGLSMGSHGIHGFRPLRVGTIELLESTEFQMPTGFWETAARAGIASCVVDVPHYPPPPDQSNGLENLCYVEWGPHPPQRPARSVPPHVITKIMFRHGCHPAPLDVEGLETVEDSADYLACACAGVRKRANVVNDLVRMTSPELLVTVFSELHTSAHQWLHLETPEHHCFDANLVRKLGSPIRRVCEAIDGAVARLLEQLPPDTTVLLPCLGGERVTFGGGYLLHDLLVRLGYTVYPTYGPEVGEGATMDSPENLRIDWTKTRAFSLPWWPDGYLRLNQRGREPYGTVADGAERTQVLDEIEAIVRSLRLAGTNQPAARLIVRPHEQYAGSANVAQLPDLFVNWNSHSPFDAVESDLAGRIENRDPATRCTHDGPGRLYAYGPSIAAGPTIRGMRDYDIAPTVLKLLGLDAPPGLDGRAITALFAESAVAAAR